MRDSQSIPQNEETFLPILRAENRSVSSVASQNIWSNLRFYKITSLIFLFHGYLKKNSNLGNINSYGVTLWWIRKCTIFVPKKALSNEIVTFQEQVVNLQFLLTVVVIQIK